MHSVADRFGEEVQTEVVDKERFHATVDVAPASFLNFYHTTRGEMLRCRLSLIASLTSALCAVRRGTGVDLEESAGPSRKVYC